MHLANSTPYTANDGGFHRVGGMLLLTFFSEDPGSMQHSSPVIHHLNLQSHRQADQHQHTHEQHRGMEKLPYMGLTGLTASSMSDAFSRAMSLSWLKPWEMRETLMVLIKNKSVVVVLVCQEVNIFWDIQFIQGQKKPAFICEL